MNASIFAAACTGIGALGYDIWGFLLAAKEAQQSPELEKFSLIVTLTTILPSIVGALLVGMAITLVLPEDPWQLASIAFVLIGNGFGWASAQNKLGINHFFTKKS